MEEQAWNLSDYVAIAKRRALYFLIPFVILAGAAAAVAVLLPPIYESKGTILIESQQVPLDLVRTTVTSFADERIQVIKQRVTTSSALIDIMDKYRLYENDRKTNPRSVLVDRMRRSISVNRVSADVLSPRGGAQRATIAFTISFESEYPHIAQNVANELVTRFLDENTRQRTESASETTEFLTKQVEKQKDRLKQIEEQIGAYKEEYKDYLPENLGLNQEMLGRAETEYNRIQTEILSLEERQKFISAQIAALESISKEKSEKNASTDGRGSAKPEESTAAKHLKALRAQYVRLAAIYGKAHPDVQNVQRQIDAFEQEVSEEDKAAVIEEQLADAKEKLAEAKNQYSDQHPDVVALRKEVSNLEQQLAKMPKTEDPQASKKEPEKKSRSPYQADPAFIQIRTELALIPGRLKSLKEQREELQHKIKDLEDRISQVPQVSRGLSALQREYDLALKEHDSLKEKQQSAALAESLEVDRKAERFTLLEPPLLPERPEKPNRLKILAMGLVVSLIGGAGTAGAAELLDRGIRGPRALARVINRPPMAIIPYIETRRDRRRRNLTLGASIFLLFITLTGGLLAVHYFYKPLDILWQLVMRRFGIY